MIETSGNLLTLSWRRLLSSRNQSIDLQSKAKLWTGFYKITASFMKGLIGHLNTNSIRNKVDMLSYMIGNKIDILMISELKLHDTFPTSQFVIYSFTEPFTLDRTRSLHKLLYTETTKTITKNCLKGTLKYIKIWYRKYSLRNFY